MTVGSSRTVFVSYSHDSTAHKGRVLALVERLRDEGVDCHLDLYEAAPPEGWAAWMDRQIRGSDYVLVVCTLPYYRRATGSEQEGVGLGARWEGSLITQALYESGGRNEKFIPLVFGKADVAHIPGFLRGATWYDVSTDDGYDDLYRRLTSQPRYPKRPLGKVRQMPPELTATTSPERDEEMSARRIERSQTSTPRTARSESGERQRAPRGELVLIAREEADPQFMTATSIEAERSIRMVLVPEAGLERAFLEDLARRSQGTLSIAYGTQTVRARVGSIKHVREAGEERYHVVFEPTEADFGSGMMEMSTTGYSADDIAQLRARRILLDERMSERGSGEPLGRSGDSMLETLVRGLRPPLAVDRSPLPSLHRQLGDGLSSKFLEAARLVAVLWLRMTGTVEHVVELDLRAAQRNALHVRFRGIRRRFYSNVEPAEIRVEGICLLG